MKARLSTTVEVLHGIMIIDFYVYAVRAFEKELIRYMRLLAKNMGLKAEIDRACLQGEHIYIHVPSKKKADALTKAFFKKGRQLAEKYRDRLEDLKKHAQMLARVEEVEIGEPERIKSS